MNQTQIKNTLVKYQEEMENLSKKAERIKGSLDSDFKKLNEILKVNKETEEEILEEADKVLEALQESINETNERLAALMEEIEEEYAKIEDDDEFGRPDES